MMCTRLAPTTVTAATTTTAMTTTTTTTLPTTTTTSLPTNLRTTTTTFKPATTTELSSNASDDYYNYDYYYGDNSVNAPNAQQLLDNDYQESTLSPLELGM